MSKHIQYVGENDSLGSIKKWGYHFNCTNPLHIHWKCRVPLCLTQVRAANVKDIDININILLIADVDSCFENNVIMAQKVT